MQVQRLYTLLALGLLTNCGFSPLLKMPDERASHPQNAYKSSISLTITGIEGYINHRLHQELSHRLVYLSSPLPLSVTVKLSQEVYALGYGVDASALRQQNILIAYLEIQTPTHPIKRGRLDIPTAYDVDGNDAFGTLSGQTGSDERNVIALAEGITQEVQLYISNLK